MLEGPDVSIEISLKDYGIAWKIGEKETRFYYGIKHENCEYTRFDWANLENNLDIKGEFDWANLEDVSCSAGMQIFAWMKLPLTSKIQDLISYYGTENIFGSSYWKGETYEEIIGEK